MLALTSVRGKEAETFKALAKFVRGEGPDRSTAIREIARIPAAYWPSEEAGPTLESLLAYIKTIPPRDRTSATALDALQLGDSLAGLLSSDRGKQVRRELGDLGVRVIRLGTITDQMLFNKDRIAAEAGKPVEIVFENSDIMPHNFVVTKPGALEEVGLLGESSSTQPGALERNYIPPSDKILVASRLLAPRDAQKLSLKTSPPISPIQPGTWQATRCRSWMTCSRTTGRERNGPLTTLPPRWKRSPAAGRLPTVNRSLRWRAVCRATG
jgi:hypothetical protein